MYIDIKVGSVTNAQRGAKLLRFAGIKATITRIEKPSPGDGCGFVLRINQNNADEALAILRKNNVRVLGVDINDIS